MHRSEREIDCIEIIIDILKGIQASEIIYDLLKIKFQ